MWKIDVLLTKSRIKIILIYFNSRRKEKGKEKDKEKIIM